jgi:hypothetical protein
MATQVEAMGMRLLRGFDEKAKGNTETAVLAGKRPNEQASITALRIMRWRSATSSTRVT